MKKKQPMHPRLFTGLDLNRNILTLFFKENRFNEKGERLVNKETKKISNEIDYDITYLFKKNESEYQNIVKYIKIQKKVVEKHQKSRNYDSCKVVESSILLMKKFKTDFEEWFKNNMRLS